MGYYRYSNWASSPPSKYAQLVQLFGAAVNELKRAFFFLGDRRLDSLFRDYRNLYGMSAEEYARKTFPRWKSGATQLSGKTMERLIDLVPPYLSSEQRFKLLEGVLKKHEPYKPNRTIRIDIKKPAEGLAMLDAALLEMRHDDILAFLPEKVMRAASWLYDNDITAARGVLADATRRRNNITLEHATHEVAVIKRVIGTGQVQAASYTVEMPAGKLSIVAFGSSKCFIATEIYGPESRQVQQLRYWRDAFLVNRKAGRNFILWYYRNGEAMAAVVRKSGVFRMAIKGGIGLLLTALRKLKQV